MNVSAGVSLSIGTLPAGKTVRVKYQITVNANATANISSQGTVSGGNFSTVNTDDPGTGTAGDATVTTVSLPPILTAFSKSVNEDTSLPFTYADFNTRFTDANSDTMTNVQITALCTNGTLKLSGVNVTLNQNIPTNNLANLTYLGSTNFYGTDTFAWKATDSFGAVADNSANVTITVAGIADTPGITSATTDEDTPSSSGLVISRHAADGAEVTHFKITGLTGGTLFKNDGTTTIANNTFITFAEGNAGLKFTPSTHQFSPNSTFTFNAQAATNNADIGLGGSTVAASITVRPIADTPTVLASNTAEDTQTAITISRNPADGVEVTHYKVTGITGGTLYLNNGTTVVANDTFLSFNETSLKFTPSAEANSPAGGVFSLGVRASTNNADVGLGGSVVTATITVSEVNDAPSGTADALSNVAEDSGQRTITFASLTGNDSKGPANESGQTLTITAVNNAVGGSAIISGSDVLFTPTADYNGAASFDYTVQDDGTTAGANDFKTATATASFTISESNDAPVASNDTLTDIAEDSGARTIPFADLTGNDSKGAANESGQTLLIDNVDSPIGGSVQIVGTDVIFTPTANYNGPASFNYRVTDNGTTDGVADPLSSTGSVSFAISEVLDYDFGDAPSAAQSSFTSSYPTLLSDDGARHVVPFGGSTLFLGLTIDFEADGQPDANAHGDDPSGVGDEDGVVLPASFVTGNASNITVNVNTQGLLNAWIDFNRDGDWSDADEQICTNVNLSSGANVLGIAGRSFAAGGTSYARFRVSTQSDLLPTGAAPDGEVEDYAVNLVAIVNQLPEPVDDKLGTREANAVTAAAVRLLANDRDPDGDPLSITAVSATSTNGGPVILSGGSITYTPLDGFVGEDSFTYTVSDGRGGSATATVVVTVRSANAPSQNKISITPTANGKLLRFAGIPGRSYIIQSSDFANGPWTDLTAPLVAGPTGVIEYEDTSIAPGGIRFYRTIAAPVGPGIDN